MYTYSEMNYIDFLASLLLLKLTKRQALLLISLYLNHIKSFSKESGVFNKLKLQHIASNTDFNGSIVSDDLESLITYNIIGSIIYQDTIGEKKLLSAFHDDFNKTLTVKIDTERIREAIRRAGFYIENGTKIYVYNPLIETWKYPSFSQIRRPLKSLATKFKKSNFLLTLFKTKQLKNNGKNTESRNVITSKDLVLLFSNKFSATYSSLYSINWKFDCKNMKKVSEFFARNNRNLTEITNFLDWAFKRAINKNTVLNTNLLTYYMNDYMAQPKKPEKNFYVDDWGQRRPKKK